MQVLDDIFQAWPTLVEMANDLEMPYQTVAKWKQRERIPSESWGSVVAALKRRGHTLTFEQIAKINPPRQSASA